MFHDDPKPLWRLVGEVMAPGPRRMDAQASTAGQTKTARRENAAVRKLLIKLAEPEPPTPRAWDGTMRLYYDGGSRGNPGNSGAGTVLLRQDGPSAARDWSIVWWGYRHTGFNSTNNKAEFTAILMGLEEYLARHTEHDRRLVVIGDNKLVQEMLLRRARMQDSDLHEMAARTDKIRIALAACSLQHSLRTGNKMADWLVNRAMDTNKTATGAGGEAEVHSALLEHLLNDTRHPWTPEPRPNVFRRFLRATLLAPTEEHQEISDTARHTDGDDGSSNAKRPRPDPDPAGSSRKRAAW